MICEFCSSTMDERKIYGVFKNGEIIMTCLRCYPIIDKKQTTLKEVLK